MSSRLAGFNLRCRLVTPQTVREASGARHDAHVGIGQVDSMLFDVVQAFVDIDAGPGLASRHLQYLESCPGPVLTGQIGGSAIFGETKNATGASENVNLH